MSALQYCINDTYRNSDGDNEVVYRCEKAEAELDAFRKIRASAIALFQKCSELTIDSMDILEDELAAMSKALKGGEE